MVKRWRRLIGVLALAWLAGALAMIAAGAYDLWSGRRAVDAARDQGLKQLTSPAFKHQLSRAEARFRAARDRFSSPLLAPALRVPGLGRQFRSARDLATSALALTRVVERATHDARELLASAPPSGAARVALVRRVSRLSEHTDRRLGAVDLGPDRKPLGILRSAQTNLRHSVDRVRADLRRATQASAALGDLLTGPRSYLVFAANNAEMRAGSGMFLSVGRLDTRDGQTSLVGMTSVTNVAVPSGVPLEGDLAARWGWLAPQTDWRNLMLSPRFKASAQLATTMWEAAGRGHVDGVVVIDPLTVRAILAATGPVSAGGRRISAHNVVDELTHDQYARYRAFSPPAERREALSEIASAAFDALNAGKWSPQRLINGLADAVQGRHMLVWSSVPAEQRGWIAAGVDGRVTPNSLLAAVLNRGGNKLDHWLRLGVELELRPVGDHTEGVVRLRVRNPTPRGEPPYVAGPPPGIPLVPGEYLGLAAITLPGRAQRGRFDGVDHLAVAGADGPNRVVATEFRLRPGKATTLVVRFRLPGRHGTLRVEPSAREPSVVWTFRNHHWRDDHVEIVTW